jgi:hypothetical protein
MKSKGYHVHIADPEKNLQIHLSRPRKLPLNMCNIDVRILVL